MRVAGIIAEYNPFHRGHEHHIAETRRLLGENCAVVAVMSGNFVQRGEAAVFSKHARAEAALRCGADLVLELPLPWALSSAPGFADGAVQVLAATGVVDVLSFGSESGDLPTLRSLAEALDHPGLIAPLRAALASGLSFPAAREKAAETLLGARAALLRGPNDLLAVEYLRAVRRHGAGLEALPVFRAGAAHDSDEAADGFASASLIRRLILSGSQDEAAKKLPAAAWEVFQRELEEGRAPATLQNVERAVLARLRSMTEADYAALPDSGEGLSHRLMRCAREYASLEEVLTACKTKRYTVSRLRRMVLWAYLGLTRSDLPDAVPYLRVLGFGAVGRELLSEMGTHATLPILTKPAHARFLSLPARKLFELEVRASDLYALAQPDHAAVAPGAEWRVNPVILYLSKQ
ncbi:MAG TPA: nucleotidyltransferase family protein [Oscillospiraceae bacterium]|nr:nucleotidyltransferase family protein [Oscillospiraceae bacterium]